MAGTSRSSPLGGFTVDTGIVFDNMSPPPPLYQICNGTLKNDNIKSHVSKIKHHKNNELVIEF